MTFKYFQSILDFYDFGVDFDDVNWTFENMHCMAHGFSAPGPLIKDQDLRLRCQCTAGQGKIAAVEARTEVGRPGGGHTAWFCWLAVA